MTIHADITEPSIFMLQMILTPTGEKVLAFFDSGCSTSAIDNHAYEVLQTQNVTPGPTLLGVAGGNTITLPGGDERFWLDLKTPGERATFTGMHMPHITTPLPTWPLQEAFNDVQRQLDIEHPGAPPLPRVPDYIGGREVNVMIGIRYLKYFPVLKFSLNCGLSVYEGMLKAENDCYGVLGGSHKSWRHANDSAQFMSPRVFFTSEIKAYRVESRTLTHLYHELHHEEEQEEPPCEVHCALAARAGQVGLGGAPPGDIAISKFRKRFLPLVPTTFTGDLPGLTTCDARAREAPCKDQCFYEENVACNALPLSANSISAPHVENECAFNHCNVHAGENWSVEPNWDVTPAIFSNKGLDKYDCFDGMGTDVSYRCLRCRNCGDCRKGDLLEQGSLEGEVEQALIESCIKLNIEKKRLETSLPFIADPKTSLAPNRHIAKKILTSQLNKIKKSPEMQNDVRKAHNKLLDAGHVCAVKDLPHEEKEIVNTPGATINHIPWMCVLKESLSTPARLVFNGSSRTSTGHSLNSILAKGENKLPKILHILIKFGSKKSGFTSDISMAYNMLKLFPPFFNYQRYLWQEDLDPDGQFTEMVIKTIIYGVICSGNLTAAGLALIAAHLRENYPVKEKAAEALEQVYVDDSAHAEDSLEEAKAVAEDVAFGLDLAGMRVKAFTFAGMPPSDLVSADGESVGLLGYLWWPEQDLISLCTKDLFFGKVVRGKQPEPVKGDVKKALSSCFTRRTVVAKFASTFDPLGLVTPVTARLKLDLSRLCSLKLDWDDPIPLAYLDLWVSNLAELQELKNLRFNRSWIHPDAVNNSVELIVQVDASEKIAIACVHARSRLPDGSFSCRLIVAKSKLVHLNTVPRGELRGAVLGAALAHTVKRILGTQVTKTIYVTDSSIVLYWLHQDQRPLQTAVRNATIEIRRLSELKDWFHVDSANNLADLGTRHASINDISTGSEWQCGNWWMSQPLDRMPILSIEEVQLNQQEKQEANKEVKSLDICGVCLPSLKDKVAERYSFSDYLVDPCVLPWPKAVRTLAFVLRFITRLKKNGVASPPSSMSSPPRNPPPKSCFVQKSTLCLRNSLPSLPENFVSHPPPDIDESGGIKSFKQAEICQKCPLPRVPELNRRSFATLMPNRKDNLPPAPPPPPLKKKVPAPQQGHLRHEAPPFKTSKRSVKFLLSAEQQGRIKDVQLHPDEIAAAERYFFLKGTQELKQFSKPNDFKNCSVIKEGIVHFSGRILDGQLISDVENIMSDLTPLSFCKPMLDRYSPISYSIMIHSHQELSHHRNSIATLRESRALAYIVRGRDLANEIRENCPYCQRFKARLIEVEMGKIHQSRLTISPAFYSCQVDLFGPYDATCEHNHRATVPVWGVIFKDPSSGAIAVYGMAKYSTGAFINCYIRHAARYGHPLKLFIDAGGQLVKACKDLEISWMDLTSTLNSQYGVGIEHVIVNTAEHSAHGVVERSVLEVKRLFNVTYRGVKLDLYGYDTAFSYLANELNSLPLCLGSRYENLENSDLITPSRLLLGRNNKRAPAGYPRISSKSRQVEQLDIVHKAWWDTWKSEKIGDYIPAPSKWHKNSRPVQIGDIVVFLRDEMVLGDSIWKLGMVDELIPSEADGIVRSVLIKYKNPTWIKSPAEKKFKRTKRAVRKMAIIYREGELGVLQTINEAAKMDDVRCQVQLNNTSIHAILLKEFMKDLESQERSVRVTKKQA